MTYHSAIPIWPARAQDQFVLAQLRCAALVAAVEKTLIPDYLDQSEAPGYFVMLRRHKPLYNRCMAACDVPNSMPSCALQGQSAAIAARYQQLPKSAEDAIMNGQERLRKGQ